MCRITTYQTIQDAREPEESSRGDEALLENCLTGVETVLHGGKRPGLAQLDCLVHG